jgi:hypothetical protein
MVLYRSAYPAAGDFGREAADRRFESLVHE